MDFNYDRILSRVIKCQKKIKDKRGGIFIKVTLYRLVNLETRACLSPKPVEHPRQILLRQNFHQNRCTSRAVNAGCSQRMRTFIESAKKKKKRVSIVSYVKKSGWPYREFIARISRHLVAQFSTLAHPDDKQIPICPRNFKPRSLPKRAKRSSVNRATNPSQSKIAPFVVCLWISLNGVEFFSIRM